MFQSLSSFRETKFEIFLEHVASLSSILRGRAWLSDSCWSVGVAILSSPLGLVLNWYLHFRSQQQAARGTPGSLISAASVNVLVPVVPLDVFAFPLTSPLESLAIGLYVVHFASPFCHGLN